MDDGANKVGKIIDGADFEGFSFDGERWFDR